MGAKQVLLTGATGLVGFRVLVFCLRKGYRVRVVLRALKQKSQILSTSSIRDLSVNTGPSGNLDFVEVPDFSKEAAWDDALREVDLVIHTASPIASALPNAASPEIDFVTHFLRPSVEGTLSLLRSAQTHPSVTRVVITSSLAALIDYQTDTDETVHTESTRATKVQQPPYRSPSEAYTAAKVSTLNLAERWAESATPHFDIVHMAPGHVFGRNELVSDPAELLQSGSNRILLQPIAGKSYMAEPGVTIHLDDVAEAHVRALDASVPGNQLYILSSGGLDGTRLDECFDIVARHFPDHVGRELPNNGSLPTSALKVDATESARLLGMDFISYEKQVREMVGYYLECVQREAELDELTSGGQYTIMDMA